MDTQNPTATASLYFTHTATGTLVRVRIVTATAILWRAYQVDAMTEAVVSRALRSAGLPQAWTQARLPLPSEPSATAQTGPQPPPAHTQNSAETPDVAPCVTE
jgi:hypothetical protein